MAKFNFKEFDYKQFLLDRGEQVGLGLALTIMVLMLTFTLFWPGRGIFSEGPAKNAGKMLENAKKLESALASAQPTEQQLPPKNQQEALIPLDTVPLQSQYYEVEGWYEPASREIQDRRPPKIYTPEETKVEIARVPVDTYLFNRDFTKIFILKDPEKKRQANNQGGGRNPFSLFNKGGMGGGMGGGMRGGMGGNPMFLLRQQTRLTKNLNTNFGSVGGDMEYETQLIDLEKWSPSDTTARQVRPCRMAIIVGSFPYKEQVNEFRKKLHLNSTGEVFGDSITDEKGNKSDAFRFLGVEVQRKEVDASGKTIKDWYDPDFRASYELWLRHSFLPMQPEDPKYAPVSFKGLVMPRLREFRADAHEGPAAASPMFGGGVAGGKNNPLQPQPNKANEAHDDGGDAKYYKEPEKELTKLNRALSKLEGSQIKNIAAPPSKFKVPKAFDPFDPTAEPPPDENNAAGGNEEKQDANADKSGGTLPDYCLMRLVDVNIDANKMYRYRLRIRMANPNYNRNDVASAEYKTAKELKSDWYEVPETVKVDSENYYYVVDQPKISEKSEKPPLNSARYRMWDARNEKRDQVAFQFLRWVEATPLDPRDADAVPVGDWAVADRVFVARGEFVGRKVKVDIPVWQYTKNAFVLPTGEKNVKEKNRGLVPTGIEVDFGQENPDNETILVDFEGGRSYHPTNKNLSDNSRTEVLMLSPDGKLLARNSAADAKDDFREKQRKKVIERIEDIRTGKSKE